jgi:hypothetical protein
MLIEGDQLPYRINIISKRENELIQYSPVAASSECPNKSFHRYQYSDDRLV